MNIDIIEMVDDGGGILRPWEDIVGAMPGESYSAIPRVRNNGELAAYVRICLSQSATNSVGESVALPNNTFGILINENWTLVPSGADAMNPAMGNCYIYNSMIEAGEVTEPVFTEVSLSSELGSEYGNSTFSLHLEAEGSDREEFIPEPVPTPAPVLTPETPETGINSASYLEIVSPVLISAGAIIIFAVVAVLVRKIYRRRFSR